MPTCLCVCVANKETFTTRPILKTRNGFREFNFGRWIRMMQPESLIFGREGERELYWESNQFWA
jgi:hypothetical protein